MLISIETALRFVPAFSQAACQPTVEPPSKTRPRHSALEADSGMHYGVMRGCGTPSCFVTFIVKACILASNQLAAKLPANHRKVTIRLAFGTTPTELRTRNRNPSAVVFGETPVGLNPRPKAGVHSSAGLGKYNSSRSFVDRLRLPAVEVRVLFDHHYPSLVTESFSCPSLAFQ